MVCNPSIIPIYSKSIILVFLVVNSTLSDGFLVCENNCFIKEILRSVSLSDPSDPASVATCKQQGTRFSGSSKDGDKT